MTSTTQPLTNWLELPSDIMSNILHRVGVTDIFKNVQKVCTMWHKICKDPVMWRVVTIDGFLYLNENTIDSFLYVNGMFQFYLDKICKSAVERSQGQLVDLTIVGFGDDELLQYVADRSNQLRRLEVAHSSSVTWNIALKKFPLLEELNLYSTNFSKEAIETAGCYCPMLKTLKVNERMGRIGAGEHVEESVMFGNEIAKAIGENLSDLRHLELIGCRMSNVGLQEILDGCCHLESLDLRNCWNIHLSKELLKRCSEKIKHLKLPDNSLEGCPYIYENDEIIEYVYHSEPWLVLDEYDDGFEDYGSFEDYDAYIDYCWEEAAAAASMNRRFGVGKR